jgi:hypothetical protein
LGEGVVFSLGRFSCLAFKAENWTYAVLKIPDKMGLKMFPYGKAAGD